MLKSGTGGRSRPLLWLRPLPESESNVGATGVIFHEVVGRGRLFFKQSIDRSVRLFQVKPPYKTTGQSETDRQTDRQPLYP